MGGNSEVGSRSVVYGTPSGEIGYLVPAASLDPSPKGMGRMVVSVPCGPCFPVDACTKQ